ncbi:hypothetical protein, partial [Kocuria carniphila]|uniref:hypothetical protein n=1 Tax=Kocuria carniphila TaxID=262208 RepID=UPI0034CF8A5A
ASVVFREEPTTNTHTTTVRSSRIEQQIHLSIGLVDRQPNNVPPQPPPHTTHNMMSRGSRARGAMYACRYSTHEQTTTNTLLR